MNSTILILTLILSISMIAKADTEVPDYASMPTPEEVKNYKKDAGKRKYHKKDYLKDLKSKLTPPLTRCNDVDQKRPTDYGWRKSKNYWHPGCDLGAKAGDPVIAVSSGVVVESIHHCKDDYGKNLKSYKLAGRFCDGDRNFGNRIIIMHKTAKGEIWYSNYHHLGKESQDNKLPRKGDVIKQGQTIGTVGSTGTSGSPHLHFEIMDKDHKRTDPYKYYDNELICGEDTQSPKVNQATVETKAENDNTDGEGQKQPQALPIDPTETHL